MVGEVSGILMIQKMRGYPDDWQEMNGQTETVWHYMVANVPGSKWYVVPDGPENGIWCACLVELSCESVMKSDVCIKRLSKIW
jgi:hypothetical protein